MSWNKKNIMKWEKDEPLGHMATISPVLYANTNHPELKSQYPGEQIIALEKQREFENLTRENNSRKKLMKCRLKLNML